MIPNFDLLPFGQKLKVQESPKSKLKKKKELFVGLIQMYENCWLKSNALYNDFGINLVEYEEDFFIVLENLIYLHFGETKGQIILWYIYDRVDMETGESGNIILENEDDLGNVNTIEYKVENVEQLWEFLNKYKSTINGYVTCKGFICSINEPDHGVPGIYTGRYRLSPEVTLPTVGRIIGLKTGVFKYCASPAVKYGKMLNLLHINAAVHSQTPKVRIKNIRHINILSPIHSYKYLIACCAPVKVGRFHLNKLGN